ncbi:MAG: peptide chain release factor 2 [Chloroflexota bacterium]|nr:peptide chain release factor 2 [Chloroflexota bacterium]
MEGLIQALESLRAQVASLMERLDLGGKTRRVAQLELLSGDAAFWSNPETAQATMREIARLKAEIDHWETLQSRVDDALELAALGDSDLVGELQPEVETLTASVERMSLQAMLSGEYDTADAILSIHAGAGGTDSQDWAAMLERMFVRWADQNAYKLEPIERMEGEEAGIKSVTYIVRGDYAYGYLQSEAGVHRLVRLSPFDSAHRRHTSFAKVELLPDIQGDIDIDINEKDLRVDTFRSSGAGGQNVQKNETAVRLTYLPTGTVVAVQNERSMTQNRDRAMQILKLRLFEIERKKREAQFAAIKGENVNAEWGNQIRSYVLHPYHLVKDHRTGHEVGNTDAVLDGRLNDFMESYLRAKINNVSLIPTAAAELE